MFEKELVSEVFKRDLYKLIEKTRDKNLQINEEIYQMPENSNAFLH